jgi:hypothetical protein
MAPPFHSASLSERYVKDKLYGRRWSDGFSSPSYCYLIRIYTHLAFPSTNQTTTPDLPNTFSMHPTSLYTSKTSQPYHRNPQKTTTKATNSPSSPLHRADSLPAVPPPRHLATPLPAPLAPHLVRRNANYLSLYLRPVLQA